MKKKLLTLGLSSTLALSSIMPAFANSISTNIDKTYIETAIGFLYPEKIESLKSKNLKAILDGNSTSIEIPLNDFLNNDTYNTNIDGYDITSEITEENGKITYIKFKIDGLKASDGYNLTLEGKNYVKTVVNLNTSSHSKRVNISTATTMVLGDINNDGKVDTSDRKLLEDNLNTNNTDYDLNNDGKITVADISIVNANMTNLQEPEIFDTEMVSSKILEQLDTSIIEQNVEITGNIENIFSEGDTVSFKAKDGEEKISIPLEFTTPQEMSSVEITIPQGTTQENVEILLEDADGNTIETTTPTPAMAMYARNAETVVTVNLGKRVPVKKVTVNIKPTEAGGYVVVDEVKFLKDIVNEDIIQDTTVKNVIAKAGDGEVSLSWRQVPNVTGYKVYYGTDENNLDKISTTDVTNITISDLENLKTYYFAISATSGDWEGNKSTIVSATPQPEKAPQRPDFVKATGEDSSITVTWKASENAKTYNIYTKTENDSEAKKVATGITGTSYKLTGLTNNVEYTIYVTSQNSVGESSFSEPAQATPKKEVIVAPTLPTRNKIDSSEIEKVEISHKDHYNTSLYPNGFDSNWLIDGDYETSWVARRWYDSNYFTFTFEEPKDMDYLIWVPRLDGKYRNSFNTYTIEVWTNDQDLNKAGTVIASGKSISNRGENDSYFIFDFPKQENVKKIKVAPSQWAGSPTDMNASEVVFYEYNDIADRIADLFANSSRTELKSTTTAQNIEDLKAEVNNVDGFVINKDILLKELDIATSLLNKNTDALGIIKDNVFSIDTSKDNTQYSKSINNWQPLGIVGSANETITIYADIPDGETVSLVPTQFFEQVDSLSASPITLQNGRNIITLPKIGSVNNDRGGSLYITYSGDKASEIKLQIIGGQKIPYLELKDLSTLDEEKVKERISTFIDELVEYVPTLKGNLTYQRFNQSEISLPNVLLSLPADQVLKGINQNADEKQAKIDKTYANVQAWEELMGVIYKTYGIDDHENDSLETRHNIRYMKMFAGAFMYAAGNHIGVGYDSVAPLMNGTPTNEQTPSEQQNNLFGWGIAHEIGHVMDKFGKAEVTNNIYSLMAQTYDGDQNTLKSRLENSNVYEKAFKKVSVGGEGVPNDVFTHLAMYWQLHLAYDNGDEPFKFYNELHKLYRTDNSLNSFTDMNKFAVASSKVAKKDLTTFFERWGVVLSDEAKTEMSNFEDETRAIYYLTDESRRERLNSTQANTNITVNASAQVNPENSKEVIITISKNTDTDKVQGYEIIRNGKSIGFTTTGTYTDFIGSANNMAFTYEVIPVDILGNLSSKQSAGQVKISYDNTIDTSLYNIDTQNKIVTFTEPTIVTGIKVTPKDDSTPMPTGKYKVYASVVSDVAPTSTQDQDNNDGYILAKDGDFSTNASTNTNAYIGYFNKPGSTEDKIWAYDVNKLKLENIDLNLYNVEFISYPGDNVEFMDLGIGRLTDNYTYGDNPEDVIPKDTLVIVGKYRGNTALSNIYVKGKFATENSLSETSNIVEREIAGYSLMFDTLDEDGTITSSTSEGIFIFVPDIQQEAEIQGDGHENLSVLPTEIMAEMWITDTEGNKQRMSSNTMWITMPTDESLPQIEIK